MTETSQGRKKSETISSQTITQLMQQASIDLKKLANRDSNGLS